ncbi:MAG TPA: HEAT repeat domain-containing protein [Sphingomicrobium sp.]
MRNSLLIILAVPFLAAEAQPGSEQRIVVSCATLDECIAVARDPTLRIRNVASHVDEAIVRFGEPAVDALIPLLADPNPETRKNAGYLLAGFRHIPPRYYAALVAAWNPRDREHGNGWLPRAVAATGTDEALARLWREFELDPVYASQSQIVSALADFGPERIRPLLLGRFAQCQADPTGEACRGLSSFFSEFGGFGFPPWAIDAYVRLAQGAASDTIRWDAETTLVRLQRPEGLAPYQKRLAGHAVPAKGDWDSRFKVQGVIVGIADYGIAARSSGPVIARFLAAEDEELRATAALAIGQVGDTASVPALMALEPKLRDDWVLAYNVAESLGRLRATQGVPLLRGLARDYWHVGVRNNAARALNAIAGGAFALPAVPGDPRPYSTVDEEGTVYFYAGQLRYDSDRQSRSCAAPPRIPFSRDPVDRVAWPRFADRELDLQPVDEDMVRQIRARIPPREAPGRVMAVLPIRGGTLVGLNGGEFGGGLYFLPARGAAVKLNGDRVFAAWRMGGRLFVAAGLAHGIGDEGHLYIVDPNGPKVERAIRLPASPDRIVVARSRAVIVATAEGDVAVRPDGRLADPARIGGCAKD